MNDTSARGGTRGIGLSVLIPFIVVTLIWGSTWIVIRDQLGIVPPSWSVTYRFLCGGVVMALWALSRGERLWLDARGWMFAALLALFQFCLNFNFVYRAEHHITSGLVAVVFALLLVPNAIWARIFLGQKMGRPLVIGSVIAIGGVAMLFVQEARNDTRATGEVLLGTGIALLAVLSASVANVMQATETARRYPMVPTLALSMLLGAAMNAAWAWGTAGPPVIEWRAGYLFGVAYLGILASAIAFTLYFNVIRAIGPARAAYSSVIIPVIAMGISTVFEGYRWSPLAIAGGVLAFAGLVVALNARSPAR